MKKSVLILMMLLINMVYADSPSDQVQAKLNAIKSMDARFTQIVKAGNREISNSLGKMAMFRPGRFRWETQSPLEQLVVADGNKLWIYDVDLEQVTVKKQEKGIGGTPGLFLSGYDNTVARDFNVTSKANGNTLTFDLHAKSAKENFQQVKLIFKGEQLSALEFFDQLGQHTMVRLSQVKNNPKLSESMFHFKPPKGVDVVNQ